MNERRWDSNPLTGDFTPEAINPEVAENLRAFKKLRPAMQVAIVLPLLASACDRFIPDTDIQTTETQPKTTETYTLPSATIAPTNTEEVIPTEEAIPLPWIERMNEAKMQEDARLVEKADWISFEEENNLEPLSVASAVQNHRGTLRGQGLQPNDYDFNLYAQDNDWAVIVEEIKTGKMLWSTNNDGSLNFRPDFIPYDEEKGLVLYNEFDLTPTPSGQHGESRSIVIKNGEVFVFYKNEQGERTAVFNPESRKIERWKDTLYLAGAEALAQVQDIRYEKVAENNWMAFDAQGNTLAKLEEGRDRWFYTEKGLEAITPEEEELKAFFEEHADPRKYTTTENIYLNDTGLIRNARNFNVVVSGTFIQASFPDKELVVDVVSQGDVYTLLPVIAKWKGAGNEEKFYPLYLNIGVEGFSRLAVAPGVYRDLDLNSPEIIDIGRVGEMYEANVSFVCVREGVSPPSNYTSLQDYFKSRSKTYPGVCQMADLFGGESEATFFWHIKIGEDISNNVIGPANSLLKK
jgi:hypothetical protein